MCHPLNLRYLNNLAFFLLWPSNPQHPFHTLHHSTTNALVRTHMGKSIHHSLLAREFEKGIQPTSNASIQCPKRCIIGRWVFSYPNPIIPFLPSSKTPQPRTPYMMQYKSFSIQLWYRNFQTTISPYLTI